MCLYLNTHSMYVYIHIYTYIYIYETCVIYRDIKLYKFSFNTEANIFDIHVFYVFLCTIFFLIYTTYDTFLTLSFTLYQHPYTIQCLLIILLLYLSSFLHFQIRIIPFLYTIFKHSVILSYTLLCMHQQTWYVWTFVHFLIN